MPDQFRTRRQLAEKVLEKLGVLDSGQTAEAEDVSRVDDNIDPALAMLAADEIIYIADPEEIQIEVFLPLADYMAWACAGSFSRANDAALKALSEEAERILKRISRPAGALRTLKVDRALRFR